MRLEHVSTLALVVAVTFGCVASTIPVDHLTGKQYRSVDELEGGLGPNRRPVPMRWRLTFGKVDSQGRGVVTWDHSDMQSGEWYQLASDGTLSGSDQTAPHRYDVTADRVLWQGKWYVRDEGG